MSFITIAIAAALLGVFYQRIALRDLTGLATSKNIALTGVFANSVWPALAPVVASMSGRSGDELRAHSDIPRLFQLVREQMRGLGVVKVKVYDLDGLTVFSTEARQIGEDKSKNGGFLAARSGHVANEFTHRDTFSAFEQTIEDRDVFSSYIPIRRSPAGPVEAVFELYSDVTPFLRDIRRTQRTVVVGVIAILTLLYVVLFFVVRHADKIMKRQDREGKNSAHEITTLNEQLEQRVSELQVSYADLRRTQSQLVQTEKVAAMGELLAGVAHELNNPLTVVIGGAALLRRAVGSGPLAARVDAILQAAERCVRIVKNFLTLAHRQTVERQEVALNQVVLQAVELVAYPLRVDNVEVTLDLASDLPVLWAEPDQLHQVVVNLITNAHQAMRTSPAPRRLTFTTRCNPDARTVILEVADTGPGIPLEIQGRIFEPFFTTKPLGQGTGLGLSLCQGIVEAHQGTIQFESGPGQGTVFRMELPVGAPGLAATGTGPAETLAIASGRTILVVDDEPEVASVLADMLAEDGHRVTVVDAAQALHEIEKHAYDLILSDVRMPDLDGPGLYREVERHRPELCRKFVFMTGDLLGPETENFLKQTRAPSFGKPFSQMDVRRTIQQALLTPQEPQGGGP